MCSRSVSKFKRYPIGYFHIDIAEVRTQEGKLYLFVAIDRTSKFASVELHEQATRRIAGDFLRALATAVPYKIQIVLTDNGTHFTDPTGDGWTPEDIKAMRAEKVPFRCHAFEGACADLDIEHRLTKPRHPWTNGQVERDEPDDQGSDRETLSYDSHDQLRQHLADFVAATTSHVASRPYAASPPTRPSAKPGQTTRLGSRMTRTTKLRDQTSSPVSGGETGKSGRPIRANGRLLCAISEPMGETT